MPLGELSKYIDSEIERLEAGNGRGTLETESFLHESNGNGRSISKTNYGSTSSERNYLGDACASIGSFCNKVIKTKACRYLLYLLALVLVLFLLSRAFSPLPDSDYNYIPVSEGDVEGIKDEGDQHDSVYESDEYNDGGELPPPELTPEDESLQDPASESVKDTVDEEQKNDETGSQAELDGTLTPQGSEDGNTDKEQGKDSNNTGSHESESEHSEVSDSSDENEEETPDSKSGDNQAEDSQIDDTDMDGNVTDAHDIPDEEVNDVEGVNDTPDEVLDDSQDEGQDQISDEDEDESVDVDENVDEDINEDVDESVDEDERVNEDELSDKDDTLLEPSSSPTNTTDTQIEQQIFPLKKFSMQMTVYGEKGKNDASMNITGDWRPHTDVLRLDLNFQTEDKDSIIEDYCTSPLDWVDSQIDLALDKMFEADKEFHWLGIAFDDCDVPPGNHTNTILVAWFTPGENQSGVFMLASDENDKYKKIKCTSSPSEMPCLQEGSVDINFRSDKVEALFAVDVGKKEKLWVKKPNSCGQHWFYRSNTGHDVCGELTLRLDKQ